MTDNRFPVASYAEALPYLRAPFTPELVRGIVVFTPENQQAPCKIALYVTSETVMSRLNIVCGLNWGVRFEKLISRTVTTTPMTVSYPQCLGSWLRRRLGLPSTRDETTRHYMQVRAHVTVFGRTFEDLGEATENGEAMAEYKARAQSFKRAVRWVEVGHCLYGADQIVMWRGDGETQLRTPTTGERTHMRPYQDERSERHIRTQYELWLERSGIRIYGQPLDHFLAAHGRTEVTTAIPPLAAAQPEQTVVSGHQGTIHPQEVPAPGIIVNPEVLQCAREAQFDDAVAHELTKLARGEEQVGQLTQTQTQTVKRWIAELSSLSVEQETVLAAIDFTLERSPDREAARAKFANWITAKAQTAHATQAAHSRELPTLSPTPNPSSGPAQASDAPSIPATAPHTKAALNDQPVSAIFPSNTAGAASEDSPDAPQRTDSESPPALEELVQATAQHGYQHRVVHRLVALAQGLGPERQTAWKSLPEDRLQEITRLLNCAAQLGWDSAHLQEMVMRAHNSAHQNTPAGRYATFANHLTHAAQDRLAEAERTAA